MKMNWGCGGDLRGNWINVDRDDYQDRAIRHDITDGPLPFEAECYDLIVANHSLQALGWFDLPHALSEFHRVLAPGGVLRVIVPDVLAGFAAHARLDRDWFPNEEEETTAEAFSRWLTWGGSNLTCFTGESLYWCLTKAGFRAERVSFGDTLSTVPEACDLDSRPNESIFMDGVKL